jgi:hypothetical protein
VGRPPRATARPRTRPVAGLATKSERIVDEYQERYLGRGRVHQVNDETVEKCDFPGCPFKKTEDCRFDQDDDRQANHGTDQESWRSEVNR